MLTFALRFLAGAARVDRVRSSDGQIDARGQQGEGCGRGKFAGRALELLHDGRGRRVRALTALLSCFLGSTPVSPPAPELNAL